MNESIGFNRVVAAARPGDRVLLAPGDYCNNFFFRMVHGTARHPIVITAADPDNPPRLVGPNAPLQFSGASHLVLSDLVVAGSRDTAAKLDAIYGTPGPKLAEGTGPETDVPAKGAVWGRLGVPSP